LSNDYYNEPVQLCSTKVVDNLHVMMTLLFDEVVCDNPRETCQRAENKLN